ncbi:PREDICTED: uncharacterized protein LOC109243511 [Nicotiana attenuata]|uniref:Uncharacterized protein n=1 Tax=Nicotiana attenuata TaxID=49451 RepID=A0A314L108_NICAT|nr:PREDICTED: uncharacterized protein LOC109243511 [Nicotiana attenuata]OIT35331.1 hypothetical protein A4A49_02738 [Nicotiana attenuata]
MAIDMISEAPTLVTSPRISFSDDLSQKDSNANSSAEKFPLICSDSNSDFDFCITNNTNTETSSADELFLDGLIRPLQLQEKHVTLNQEILKIISKTQPLNSSPNQPTPNDSSNQEILKQKDQTKSFWRIRRSSSLHCVNSNKKSSFWSLPLLSRSNSTGSEGQKNNAQFKKMKNMNTSAANFYTFPSSQKPPLRKNYGLGHNYGNGVCINPVLNVPPTFITKGTANLFGLGSFFANGKEKKGKK